MEMRQLGARAAGDLKPAGGCGGRSWARRVRRALAELSAARDREARRTGETSAAAEWLLDNWYLAQREGKEAERTLRRAPRRFRAAEGSPYPARLAQVLAEEAQGVDPEALDGFLAGVQRTSPLSELELAYFVPALKGELVCRLAALCARLDGDGQDRALGAVFTALRLRRLGVKL